MCRNDKEWKTLSILSKVYGWGSSYAEDKKGITYELVFWSWTVKSDGKQSMGRQTSSNKNTSMYKWLRGQKEITQRNQVTEGIGECMFLLFDPAETKRRWD